MLPPVETRLTVQVLIHRLEQCRPSSTGKLVGRVVAGAACHVYQRGNRFFPATGYPADALEPGRELWVLHPSGDPLPELAATEAAGPQPHPAVLLLDGSWRQAGEMLASMHGRGRCVRLPATATSEPSRYWLRDQAKPDQLCTAEALMGVLEAVGEPDAWQQLAFAHYQRQEWRECHAFAVQAVNADGESTHATDPEAKTKAYDLAAVAAWNLGLRPEALQLAREAVARCPADPRLAGNVEAMERIVEAAA